MAEGEKKQKYTFAELFRKQSNCDGYRIEIPIIQRDYAQGRVSDKVSDIRTDFVAALFEYLEDEGQTHELDFVYGSSEYAGRSMRKFIPLDGQQRLTTLFLLHWYLAQRAFGSEASEEFTDLISNGELSTPSCKFTYRTRRSSADFCNELIGLMASPLDFNDLKTSKEVVDGKEIKIPSVAKTIKNLSWYSPLWDQDPTIQSMLVMLDQLHKTFGSVDHEHCLMRLLDVEKPAIGFTFMDLDEYRLTEDLYIKMNSRGKPLTSFENFKAKFEQHIGNVESDPIFDEKRKRIAVLFEQKKSPIKDVKQYFSFNIDTTWTNFFWSYCLEELNAVKEVDREKVLEQNLDTKIANFIRVILTNAFAITTGGSINKSILVDDRKPEISYNQYTRINALTPFGINLLIDSLDAVNNGNEKLSTIIPDSIFYNEAEVIENAMRNKLGYVMRVRLHAYLVFIIAFGKDKPEDLEAWMHFVYNLTHTPNLENPITADNVYTHLTALSNLIDKMKVKGLSAIDKYLLTLSYGDELGFKTSQEKEEIIKAHIRAIPQNGRVDWAKAIEKYEDHNDDSYLSGQIEFLFEMTGIQQYFSDHGDCKWTDEDNEKLYRQFCKYGDIALEIFRGGYEARVYAGDSLLERAMLALHPEYINSNYNLLNSTLNAYNIRRDVSWKRLLHTNHSNRVTLKLRDLFDKISIDEQKPLSETLRPQIEEIIKVNQPSKQWLRVLVNSKKVIGYSYYGFISCQYGQHILHAKKRNSDADKELFTLDLYLRMIKGKESLFPGMELSYQSANIYYMYPHIKAPFDFGGHKHILKLEHNPKDNDFGNYILTVYVVNSQNERTPGLESALANLDFSPIENNSKIMVHHLPDDLPEAGVLDTYRSVFAAINQYTTDVAVAPATSDDSEQPTE